MLQYSNSLKIKAMKTARLSLEIMVSLLKSILSFQKSKTKTNMMNFKNSRLRLWLKVRNVWKNGSPDSFRRYETHEFASNTKITKIMLSLR